MNWLWLIASYLVMEAFINVIFHFITQWLKNNSDSRIQRRREIIKGVLERLFIIIGVLIGYPQVIIAFGALKIGTRFQKNSKISNDYFLIGNFISVLVSLLYIFFVRNLIIG